MLWPPAGLLLWDPMSRLQALPMNTMQDETDLNWADLEVGFRERAKDIPISRLDSTDEVAAAIACLASDAAGFVMGQAINVDGGWQGKPRCDQTPKSAWDEQGFGLWQFGSGAAWAYNPVSGPGKAYPG